MAEPDEKQIAAFSELLSANRARVFGYIYAMLHNMSDAEDVYQQTTVLVWEKFGEFEHGTDFGSWALKIAYFNIKNFQRKRSRQHRFFTEAVMEKVADSYDQKGSEGESEARLQALVKCVEQLPSRHRVLLKKRYGDNVSVKSLAKENRKSESAMSMALGRIRKTLLECISARLATE